jgi:hypothetical protein
MTNDRGITRQLTGTRAKMARSQEHVTALYADIDAWHASRPYTLSTQARREGRQHTWSVTFHDPIPFTRWGVILGDALHNLRSALDHLAWQLALRDNNPPMWTKFPVFTSEQAFHRLNADGNPAIGSGLRCISGFADELARSAVEFFQPFSRAPDPRDSPLWILHWLNNADKHQVVKPVLMSIEGAQFGFKTTGALDQPPAIHFNHSPLEDGKNNIARLVAEKRIIALDEFDYTVEVKVDLPSGNQAELFALMNHLLGYVVWIVDEFDHSFFGGEPPQPLEVYFPGFRAEDYEDPVW